ncbi:MAG: response regulator [Proteobacteria bacterium]|uniref:histidine kinase n=1 Tax=Pseudodesulfovibrio aespoeensis (strain ATCC 700646 / DSM 10631 / Aspo-2) TaxID=643562 RepID=E6VUJ6_PSEA9|nr:MULTISPECIES: PAS domain-containing sensor histidine kinase [Pseudodesulfovibrio]ADU61141.1 PAS sensor protein [Pseudodesulfovibrio aespoeensis Aspo-2]MBU4191044.1 response regulator [Pseudomonadota bacterium]MCG2732703.1 response regulator [Pseudodesulfovibrio aespoeensis]
MKAGKATIEALLNATEDSGILIDLDGRFIALNNEAARRRNTTVEALIGKSLYAYLDQTVAEQRRACIREVVMTKTPNCAEEWIGDRCYRVSFYPVIDDTGDVVQVASYSRDRTETKHHEAELIRAKEMAESASMAKTQFLSNMSHELRTPLNGILGISQVALGEPLDMETRNNFEMIHESGLRLLNVLNNLLDLAAIERRSIEPVVREFDLSGLLSSTRKSFSLQANLNRVELLFAVDPDLPCCWFGDEHRLGQILSNLISNSLQCTREGVVRVTVTGEGRRRSGRPDCAGWQDVRFVVEDTGPGIDEQFLSTIFDSFSIAEQVMTKRYSGAGVGLSIVRALVEMMGGSIRVQSCRGQGTEVAFFIPLAESGNDCGESGRLSPCLIIPGMKLANILVVDDDPINLFTTTRMLVRSGFSVREAANGAEALDILRSHAIDLILMDIQMPVMDGFQAASHIRNGEVPGVDRHIPIIALTAYGAHGDCDRFARHGINDFITKPISPSGLDSILARHLASA